MSGWRQHRQGHSGDAQRLDSWGKHRTAPSPTSVSLAERFLEDIFPRKEGGWCLRSDPWMGLSYPAVGDTLGKLSLEDYFWLSLTWKRAPRDRAVPTVVGLSFYLTSLHVYLTEGYWPSPWSFPGKQDLWKPCKVGGWGDFNVALTDPRAKVEVEGINLGPLEQPCHPWEASEMEIGGPESGRT